MINFAVAVENLRSTGFNPLQNKVHIHIPDADIMLTRGIDYFVNQEQAGEEAVRQAKWLPEYEEIAHWLDNNHGKGLLCYGNCGRGKSLICTKIIPVLLNYYCRKIVKLYDSQAMNSQLDEVKRAHILCIDDVGTESMAVKYGEKRMAFSEVVDEAEKKGKLLIITTNLLPEELAEKYGERTMDRLVGITKRVKFVGKSLR